MMVTFFCKSFATVGIKLGKPSTNRCGILGFWRNYSEISKTPHTNEPDDGRSKINENWGVTLKSIDKQFINIERKKIWSEYHAVKKQIKSDKFLKRVDCLDNLLKEVQSWRFPKNHHELLHRLKKKQIERDILSQQFLPERLAILRGELAAAHFLIARGGKVKFLGNENWVGAKEAVDVLPSSYVPGFMVECINAEDTGLRKEGLENLRHLDFLNWLSLKGLEDVDDWFLDKLSSMHKKLKYLDISHCKNVSYRSLSCFYRFECLETLNVEGVPDPPEFKVACLMLQDVKPNLEIVGINLEVPDKIEGNEDPKQLYESNKSVSNI